MTDCNLGASILRILGYGDLGFYQVSSLVKSSHLKVGFKKGHESYRSYYSVQARLISPKSRNRVCLKCRLLPPQDEYTLTPDDKQNKNVQLPVSPGLK